MFSDDVHAAVASAVEIVKNPAASPPPQVPETRVTASQLAVPPEVAPTSVSSTLGSSDPELNGTILVA